jgi:hypothetical protein
VVGAAGEPDAVDEEPTAGGAVALLVAAADGEKEDAASTGSDTRAGKPSDDPAASEGSAPWARKCACD